MYTPLSPIIILDIETIIKKDVHYILKIGVIMSRSHRKRFKIYHDCSSAEVTVEQILMDIAKFSKPKKKVIIYCHNLSRFDGPLILKYLLESTKIDLVNIISTNAGILCIEIIINDIVYLFKDSIKLLPFSLKRLSKMFSTKNKSKLPINPRNICTPPKSLNNYLKKDLLIVKDVLQGYHNVMNKKFSIDIYNYLSSPSLSITLFRAFNNRKMFTIKNKKVRKFIRKSYKGGVLFSSLNKSYKAAHYDVNSLYAFSMLNKHPIGQPRVLVTKTVSNIFGFIKIDKLRTSNHYPLIKLNRTHFFSEELKFLCALGFTFNIIKCYSFDHSFSLFNKLVNTVYLDKREDKGLGEKISKVILNSLYGRLGVQDLTVIKDRSYQIYVHPTLTKKRREKDLTNASLIKISSVALASAIASYSRINMYQHAWTRSLEYEHINTDSLIISTRKKDLIVNDEIGSFKKTSPVHYQEGLYLNLKTFILKSTTTSKTKMTGSQTGKWENFEDILANPQKNFYEPRWVIKQTDILTQTRKIKFSLATKKESFH